MVPIIFATKVSFVRYLCSLWDKYENVIAVELMNEPPLGGLPNLCYALSIWHRVDPPSLAEKNRIILTFTRFWLGAIFFVDYVGVFQMHTPKKYKQSKRQIFFRPKNREAKV